MIADLAAGTYAIDATASQIRFTATHAFGLGPVTGIFTIRDGTITVTADPAECAVTARVDAASFTTHSARRDRDIRSKRFLHAQAYPDMHFVCDRLVRDGDRWLLHGKLTIRGTTAPATLELRSTTTDANGYRFRARARIDRYAYRVGSRGFVGRYVNVEFDIVGSPQP
jgi:polyisoprenoid-binding protein YceI